MRTRVKICGLTRETDVDAAVAAGADAVGFVFYDKSPRCVSIQQAQRLVRRLPAWVAGVGLFVNTPRSVILRVSDQVGLSHIQLHGDESPEDCAGLGRPVIKAIRVEADDLVPGHLAQRVAPYMDCQAVLFDADSAAFGGSGRSFDWSVLTGAFDKAPGLAGTWVLSGGLESGSVGRAISQVSPPCVDVSSGVEQREGGAPVKGLKDAQRIDEFIAAVRAADQRSAG